MGNMTSGNNSQDDRPLGSMHGRGTACSYPIFGSLHRMVTGDECWVHYFQPETKRASMERRHSSLPKPKKVRTTRSAGKLMLTLFWNYKGPILEHYMPRGLTINSESYCGLLQNHLKPAIRSKRRGLLSSGVLLQHDNARPHTARATAKKIMNLRLECIPHPAYSPDLAPSDYHVFGPLKEAVGGKKFSTDDEIKEAMHRWLRSQSSQRSFFLAESRH
jgi:histone-lysine N-methyltransferase SETMAR